MGGPTGFYRGYFTTVAGEIPFSLIQFPIWERMKKELSAWQGRPYSPWQGALCGSISGGFAAAVTTPLDVAKTRMMLGQSQSGLLGTLSGVYAEGGIPSIFSGLAPRTFWISLGGFVFFGAYEKALQLLPYSGLW